MKKIRGFVLGFFFYFFRWTSWFKYLPRRTYVTRIGLSGHVSLIDESIAKEEGLKPLNRFERWLLSDLIKAEKEHRQEIFRQVVREELGEDICPNGHEAG